MFFPYRAFPLRAQGLQRRKSCALSESPRKPAFLTIFALAPWAEALKNQRFWLFLPLRLKWIGSKPAYFASFISFCVYFPARTQWIYYCSSFACIFFRKHYIVIYCYYFSCFVCIFPAKQYGCASFFKRKENIFAIFRALFLFKSKNSILILLLLPFACIFLRKHSVFAIFLALYACFMQKCVLLFFSFCLDFPAQIQYWWYLFFLLHVFYCENRMCWVFSAFFIDFGAKTQYWYYFFPPFACIFLRKYIVCAIFLALYVFLM